jgi:uncharacterized protein
MADQQPTICVTGTGLASGSPDQCLIRISLNHSADSAADAVATTAELATRAIAALEDLRIDRCDVRTTGLSVQDFFDKTQQRVTAHIGSYQLEVTVSPLDEAGTVFASLTSAIGDALQIRGISLTLEDPEPIKSEARRLAIRDATKKAGEMADELGVRLGTIISVQDQPTGRVGVAQPASMAMSGNAGATTVPLEPGSVSASSVVFLTYLLTEDDSGSLD